MNTRPLRLAPFVLLLLAVAPAPARAQWAPIPDIPATEVFTVRAFGDTIVAGVDTALYVSTNAGLSFTRSAKPVSGVQAIDAAWVRNGRLYAGTFGQGVFVSDNLGATWSPYNQGLVGGTQLAIVAFEARADTLYAATAGAGVYARAFAPGSTWHPFGTALEPNQASNVNALALGGTRLVAAGGANGMVFRNDPGEPDWTTSFLNNVGLSPGLQADAVLWTGTGWVVGTNTRVFRSATGQEPWAFTNLGLGTILHTAFTKTDPRLVGAFNAANFVAIEASLDQGATWQVLEIQPGIFVYELATSGGRIFAARADGLWRRDNPNVSVPDAPRSTLSFALEGAQPVRGTARLRLELPEAAAVRIATYDVRGRAVGSRYEEALSAGPHLVSLDFSGLPSGVYAARITAGGRSAGLRLVHVR